MNPLSLIGINLVALSIAHDRAQDSVGSDIGRLLQGLPTRRQLKLHLQRDREAERLERMRAGQLAAFAR